MKISVAELRGIEREYDLAFETLVEAIETALLKAYQHTQGPHASGAAEEPRVVDARVVVDRQTGEVTVLASEIRPDGTARGVGTTLPRTSAGSPR